MLSTVNDKKQQEGSRDMDHHKISQCFEPSARTYNVPLGIALPFTKIEVRNDGESTDEGVGSIWIGESIPTVATCSYFTVIASLELGNDVCH